jgi:tight adherence protein B
VTQLAMFCGLLVIGGLMLAWTGLTEVPVKERGNTARRVREPIPPQRLVIIAAPGLALLVITRWPVAALGASVAAWFATSPALKQRNESADIADALTTWAEMLRDATGTPRGIEGVLVATAAGAPVLIRPHVVRLARRLPYESLDTALDGLADDLDHPIGDLVVTALRLSAHAGGRHIRAILDDLASTAREEAQMHRRVEVARARPRADMRSVLMVMAMFVTLLVVVAQDYLAPYRSAVGQVILLVVGIIWAFGVMAMGRLGRGRPTERFLAMSGDNTTGTAP